VSTARDRAKALFDTITAGTMLTMTPNGTWSAILEAFEAAVVEEREACAVICDEEADHPEGDSADAASRRIRAMGTK
jgi:hypothetical protein